MFQSSTPLREELIKWAGYKFNKKIDMWVKNNSKILLKKFENEKWHAYLIAEVGKEKPYLCEILNLQHLILLSLVLDGDIFPLFFNKRKSHE